jgi:hypothetical protein
MIKIILIALFSCGWLAPLYLVCIEYARRLDILLRQEQEDNSIGLLYITEKFLFLACIWLAAVIFFWSVAIGKRIFLSRKSS